MPIHLRVGKVFNAVCERHSLLAAGTLPGNLQGPYGASTVPLGYGGVTGGFYINRDNQPQVPAAPKLGGFYQRDACDVEAQLLAQAFAARTGQPSASQPAPSLAPDVSALPHQPASGRLATLPEVSAGLAGTSTAAGGAPHPGSRVQLPAAPSAGQHGAAGLSPPAQVPTGAGPWTAGRPLPSNAGALLGQAGQLPGGALVSGLPPPALWPTQPNQLGQPPGSYNLFPGSLGVNMAASSGVPGFGMTSLGAAGQGVQGLPGYLGQYGASNAGRGLFCMYIEASPAWWSAQAEICVKLCCALPLPQRGIVSMLQICCGHTGGGFQSAYGLQNGAVHLGSGQPTAKQGFAGLSNLQLQQRLALLQESSGVGLPGQGLQASSVTSP